MSALVRQVDKVAAVQDICGVIRPLTNEVDCAGGNVAHVFMDRPSMPHYHHYTVEFYYILFGAGTMVVGLEVIPVREGTLVMIPVNTAHYLIPYNKLALLVFSVPAWSAEDEVVIPPETTVASYSPLLHRDQLVEELLRRKNLTLWLTLTQLGRESLERRRKEMVEREGWNKLSVVELANLLKVV